MSSYCSVVSLWQKPTPLIIGVVVVFVTSILSFLSSSGVHFHKVIVLVSTVLMFVLSAVTLILAIDVRAWQGRYLDQKFKRSDDLLKIEQTPLREEILDFYESCKINQWVLTDLANLVSASYFGIRNGILCLGVLFLLIVTRLAVTSPSVGGKREPPGIHHMQTLSDAVQTIAAHRAVISKVTIATCQSATLLGNDGRPLNLKSVGIIVETRDGVWYMGDNAVAEGLLNNQSKPLDGIRIHIER